MSNAVRSKPEFGVGVRSGAFDALYIFSSASKVEDVTPEERELVQHVQEKLRVEAPVFKEHKGFVTQVSSNAIELDHKWNYQLGINDRFDVGERVSYKVYYQTNNLIVKDVVLLIEKDQFVDKTVSGIIIKVEGTRYELTNGAAFNLKDVRTEFMPVLFDLVCLEGVMPKKEEEVEDFDEDLSSFAVKRVVPGTIKLITGSITSFNPVAKSGLVGSDVLFHQNVCDKYTPNVGDNVVCNVIEGRYADDFNWRAVSLSLNTSYESNSRHMFVVSPVPRFSLILGETKIVDLKLSNHSYTACKILSVQSWTHKNSSIPPDYPEVTVIPAHTTVTWPVKVYGERLGPAKTQFKWNIQCKRKTLTINSYLSYTTIDQDVGNENENCVQRYSSQIVIPGQSKIRKPVFRKVPCKDYIMPQLLRDLIDGEENYNNVLEMQIVLQSHKPSLAESLNDKNYDDWMHTVLFLEELAEEGLYNKLKTQGHLYLQRGYVVFGFPLESAYSRVVCGDSVIASKPWEDVSYEGKIWEISATQMFCKFNPEFEGMMRQGALYNLSFKMNRNGFKRRHQAVDIVLKKIGVEWLFPSVSFEGKDNLNEVQLNVINHNLNNEQKSAVKNILSKNNLPHPYIIYGPPGTGKTMTVAELILQVYAGQADSRILVGAPTNSAVDTLGIRLLSYKIINKQHMIRLSSYNSYSQGLIATQLVDISYVPHLGDPSTILLDDREPTPTIYMNELGKHRITIGTLSTLSILNSVGLEQGFFTHVIVDEAGQCHEPDTLLPIALIDPQRTQLVLAGDPMQLGPTITSTLAKQYSFNRSFLDRLTSTPLYKKKFDDFESSCGFNPCLIARLVYNYRSLPKIVELVGETFYDSDLLPVISPANSREADVLRKIEINGVKLGERMTSLLFINVNTRDDQIEGNFSWFNNGEIVQVMNVLNSLYDKGISPDDIGVITPYSLQVRKIYELLDSLKLFSPKVASVEEFQGQERDIIIMSLVRNNMGQSKKLSPFVCDPQRINVALSRAKVLNVIIGNQNTLSVHPMWVNIISKCHVINFVSQESSIDRLVAQP